MPEQVIVLGAGGHGKVVADAILSAGDTVLGFLDDRPGPQCCLGYSGAGALWCMGVLGGPGGVRVRPGKQRSAPGSCPGRCR